MIENPQHQPDHDFHLNPDPSDPEYYEKTKENSAVDSAEGENNPNYSSRPN